MEINVYLVFIYFGAQNLICSFFLKKEVLIPEGREGRVILNHDINFFQKFTTHPTEA